MLAGRGPLAMVVGMALAAGTLAAAADPGPVFRYRSGLAQGSGGAAPSPGQDGPADGPRFVPLPQAPSVSVVDGGRVDAVVGSYEGEPGQWSCAPFPGAAWLGCAFEDGKVRLVGVADGERTGPVDVTVTRPGYSATASVPVTVTASAPSYAVSELGDRYVVAGAAARIAIGDYTGGTDGWSCSGRSGPLASWQGCLFEGGRVYLSGTAPSDHGATFNSYAVSHRGELKGYTSSFWLHRSDRGYDSPPRLDAPRAAKAVFLPARALYVPQGSSHRFKVGSYTGGDGGWACFGRNGRLASWLDCDFRDGEIFLTVDAPKRTYSYNGIAAVRDGAVVGQGDLSWINTDNRAYTHGGPDTGNPRAGQVAMARAVDRYAVAGETTRFRIGTYTGGEGGWTCFGYQNQMPGWLSCEFKDGEIVLVAAPGERSYSYNSVAVVRDGVQLGRSDLFWMHSDNRGYVQGAATTLAPRTGTASMLRASDRYAVAGSTTRFKIGTYTGGDGGWACFGYQNQMPTWLSCEFVDGDIVHVAAPGERTYTYNSVTAVRDGVQVARTDLFWLHSDVRGYPEGEADTLDPRPGAATLLDAVDLTAPAGRIWETRIGSYTGGDGGWNCRGVQNPMPSWAACTFRDGGIYLTGTAPDANGQGYAYTNVAVVRDGYQKAMGNLFWPRW